MVITVATIRMKLVTTEEIVGGRTVLELTGVKRLWTRIAKELI